MTLDDRLLAARDEYLALDAPTSAPHDHRPHRPGIHRRRTVALATAAIAALAGGVTWAANDDGHDVRTSSDTTTTTTTVRDVGEVEPTAPEDEAVTLTPEGPYRDGQDVTLEVPAEYGVDFYNGSAFRQCAILSGRGGWPEEVCDPLIDEAGPGEATSITATVRRTVLTPTGVRDCEDTDVSCRLVVRRQDGSVRATARLRFVGGPIEPSTRLEVRLGDQPGTVVVDPSGLQPDPSWIDLREQDPERAASYAAFGVSICAFSTSATTAGPYGEYLWDFGPNDLPSPNCAWQTDRSPIDPDHPDDPVTLDIPGWLRGYEGFSNCAVDVCFVRVTQSVVGGVTAGGALLGGETGEIAGIVPVDDRVPPPELPSLRIVTPPPYTTGQDLTLEVTGVDLSDLMIGFCDVDSPWACGYTGHRPGPTSNQVVVTLPSNMAFCGLNRCYLEIDSRGEGMPPPATAALPEVRPIPPAGG